MMSAHRIFEVNSLAVISEDRDTNERTFFSASLFISNFF